jgi:hypothetical protein
MVWVIAMGHSVCHHLPQEAFLKVHCFVCLPQTINLELNNVSDFFIAPLSMTIPQGMGIGGPHAFTHIAEIMGGNFYQVSIPLISYHSLLGSIAMRPNWGTLRQPPGILDGATPVSWGNVQN